jgi:hypothetical protein
LNRLELTGAVVKEGERYKKVGLDSAPVDRLLGEIVLQAPDEPPKQMVLDLGSTDDPRRGNQEGQMLRFLHPSNLLSPNRNLPICPCRNLSRCCGGLHLRS